MNGGAEIFQRPDCFGSVLQRVGLSKDGSFQGSFRKQKTCTLNDADGELGSSEPENTEGEMSTEQSVES